MEVQEYVESLERNLQSAADEISRLNEVIYSHVRVPANAIIGAHRFEPLSTFREGGMRTLVRLQPQHHEFYLAESLVGWSEDHKHAFTKMVVRGFAEAAADLIARSIWSTWPTNAEKIDGGRH